MIKDKKKKPNQNDKFPDVKTPAPPQNMDPNKPMQDNADHEKEQRPGKHKPDADKKEEKAKLLGDQTEIDDETTI